MSSEYPEHQKLEKIQHLSQACHDFVDWLNEQGIWLAEYDTVSEACRNCDHDDPHRTVVNGGSWFCGVRNCSCAHNLRGNPDRLYVTPRTQKALLGEHFGIDQNILEREKQAMLAELRKLNAEPAASRGPA